MKRLFYFLFVVLLLVPITVNVYAETWQVKIPAGSSDPNSPTHFLPEEISVRPGDKVEWGNADTVAHTVTSGSLFAGPTGIFDSGHMNPGDKFYFTFGRENIGENMYFCTIHPWMSGIVNVVDLAKGFQIVHNVGAEVSAFPVDVEYKVQRNLVNVKVDPARSMLIFNFAGRVNNDEFVVRLDENLIKDPHSVWIDDRQITNYKLTQMGSVTQLSVVLNESAEQVKIVGTSVIGEVVPGKHVLINQIFGVTDKKFYGLGEDIVISGEIKNPVQLHQISVDLVGPQGNTVYHKDIPLLNSTKFTESVSTVGVLRDFGEYMVKITGPDAKNLFLHIEYGIAPKEFESPLKQMKKGIDAGDVICNEGLELLMKNSDGNAVCVTKPTASILLQRGWADYF